MNKKALIGLGLTAALAGTVATPAIVTTPTVAYAEDFQTVTTADELKDAVKDGGNIKLGASITASITIPAGKTVVLDLNGFTLTNEPGKDTITVAYGTGMYSPLPFGTYTPGGVLTIEGNGVVDNVSNGKAAIYNQGGNNGPLNKKNCGTVHLNGGTFTRSAEAGMKDSSGGNSYYTLRNEGVMDINSGVVVNQGPNNAGKWSSLIENGYGSTSEASPSAATLNIKGGTFSGGLNTIKNDSYGTLTIDGGDFKSSEQAAIFNWNTATVTGGTFEADEVAVINGSDTTGNATGTLNVTGGSFTAPTVLKKINASDCTDFGSAAISGGTFDGEFATENITGTTISAGATFSDLNTLRTAAQYLNDGLAVETKDGESFTVATTENAKSDSGCVVDCEFTQGKDTAVYFKGTEEAAKATAQTTFAKGDDSGESQDFVKPVSVEKATVEVAVQYVNDPVSAADVYTPVKTLTYTVAQLKANSNKITVGVPSEPILADHVFAGWWAVQADNSEEGSSKQPVEGTTLEETIDDEVLKYPNVDGVVKTNAVFFASWYNDHVVVAFDTDGGSKVDDLSLSVNSDGEAILRASDLKTPTKAGYTFDGWAMKVLGEDGNETWEKVNFPKTLGATLNPTQVDTFELKATWKQNATTPSDDKADKGDAGDKGDTGNTGNNGNAGNNGNSGSNANNGETTNNGENGSSGENANKGNADANAANGEAANKTNGTTTTTTVKKAVQTNVLPATGDNAIAAAAGIAAVGAAAVAAAAATKRRNNA